MNLKNIFFYGNIYIALSALVLSIETMLLISNKISLPLSLLIFFGTVTIYSIHRLISLKKIDAGNYNQRFKIILNQKYFLLAALIITSILALISFFYINFSTKLILILLSIPTLGYVFPLFKGKRVRDFHYIKIFIIASVWAGITVFLPIVELKSELDYRSVILFVERCLFVFAITIPFDIRDIEIEKSMGIKTLPNILGEKNSKFLGIGILMTWTVFTFFNFSILLAAFYFLLAILSGILVFNADSKKNDLFFTAYLDGTMLLHGLGGIAIHSLF